MDAEQPKRLWQLIAIGLVLGLLLSMAIATGIKKAALIDWLGLLFL